MEKISREELTGLVQSVFPRFSSDRALAILIDFPNYAEEDNRDWAERRITAAGWWSDLNTVVSRIGLERIDLIGYASVGSNNADLPETACKIANQLPKTSAGLPGAGEEIRFDKVFAETQLFLAPTEFSTTAPLKVAAKKFGFRAATMPGFSSKMIPALRVDYGLVNQRVQLLKARLDEAQSAKIIFIVDAMQEYKMNFDLRFRSAYSSGGRFPEAGAAGNLPSGETYIVPYEGEMDECSVTNGILPVQLGEEIVLYKVEQNRAKVVLNQGSACAQEAELLRREPAYGNMAELGFGVLADFGLQPIGEILLDEKLGLHVAFGRSDHFGGRVGPWQFSSPQAVVHLDRIYLPATQPRISVSSVVLEFRDGRREVLMEKGKYLIF
jgi:hypothetical protein